MRTEQIARPGARRPTARPTAGVGPGAAGALLAALVLLAWAGYWAACVRADRMLGSSWTWVPAMDFLAGDFRVHIDHTARVWAAGGDPYEADGFCKILPYPPLIPRLFGWVAFLSEPAAVATWMGVSSAILAAGAAAAWRLRPALGNRPIPLALALAATALSTPVVFVLERGQCDTLTVALLLAVVALLGRRSGAADVAAGLVLAVAAWLKYYPGLAVLGLLVLRRPKAVAGFVAGGAALGLAYLPGVLRSLENAQLVARGFTPRSIRDIYPWGHSLGASWRPIAVGFPGQWLERLPGPPATAALFAPLVGWVCWRVARGANRDRLALPLLLWLVAAGTFIPPISNDYNLTVLPLAALCVWDRRDTPIVHVLMAWMLLWWQPFALPISGPLLLVFKLAGLTAVGLSLAARAGEPTADDAPAAVPAPHLVA